MKEIYVHEVKEGSFIVRDKKDATGAILTCSGEWVSWMSPETGDYLFDSYEEALSVIFKSDRSHIAFRVKPKKPWYKRLLGIK